MSKLVLHIPGGGTRDIKLDGDRITIGRRADNDIHLPYPAVSGEHAAVITVREDSFLEDLLSTNGTIVNGKRITKHFLHDHDVIDVGRVQLVYVMNDDEVVEPLAASKELSEDASESVEHSSSSAGLPDAPSEESDRPESGSVENLLAELMSSGGEAPVGVAIAPTVSNMPAHPSDGRGGSRNEATAGVYLEVMSGPNAGQIAPITKREFVLRRAGSTMAIIMRDDVGFLLVPVDLNTRTGVNEERVPAQGARLAFGDTIDVGGVTLRFGRRPPLY